MNIADIRKNSESAGVAISIRARWVFPVTGPPLENGTVEITAGRISAVHDRTGPCSIDLGNAAIIPGLVNAHTHLELSDIATPLQPPVPFTAWLLSVIGHRRTRRLGVYVPGSAPPASRAELAAIRRGREECLAGGTTTIGDIAGSVSSALESAAPGPRVVAFLESRGLARERLRSEIAAAGTHLAGASGTLRGLSPHAPYSVHPELFRGLVDLAVGRHAPVAMHLAETCEELDLLANGTGPFVPFLEELGVWQPDAIPRGCRPLDYLRELARVEHALAIHGNYLEEEEQDFLNKHPNVSVVYCPRTHAFFGHEPHPWRKLIARGVNVALGTDSRASNPDLSLWNEVLFLRARTPDLDPAVLLTLGTLNGATALGLDAETGSLTVGKSADLAVIALAAGDVTDPYALLFRPENRIAGVMYAGKWEQTDLPAP